MWSDRPARAHNGMRFLEILTRFFVEKSSLNITVFRASGRRPQGGQNALAILVMLGELSETWQGLGGLTDVGGRAWVRL